MTGLGLANHDTRPQKNELIVGLLLSEDVKMIYPNRRYAELITERTVERFLLRLFLREAPIRVICIVCPYITALQSHRFSLTDLRRKIEKEKIPTYVITREPAEEYHLTAIEILRGCPWIEIRYNASIHAKLYVVSAFRESDSFALFGSGNLTFRSVESNIELGMMVYSIGPGKDMLRELSYWSNIRLRTIDDSHLIQKMKAERR